MPIYAYKCASCGFAKDVLQKMSDAPLTVCPSCGQPRFAKQVTAASFQLKGSGWYVTDFRNARARPGRCVYVCVCAGTGARSGIDAGACSRADSERRIAHGLIAHRTHHP